VGDNSNTAEFFLGEDPPNPLEMEIYLSADFKGTLHAQALYSDGEGGYLRAVKEIGIGE
jgi:hypothetical protein